MSLEEKINMPLGIKHTIKLIKKAYFPNRIASSTFPLPIFLPTKMQATPLRERGMQ